jgi:hypothetical protein
LKEAAMPYRTDENREAHRSRWVFWAFLLIAGFFLVAEHRAHLLPYWPLLLLLLCPLLHLFHGHGGHGAHRGRTHANEDDAP